MDAQGHSVTGRMMILMMYRYFVSNNVNHGVHTIADLMKYKWQGDHKNEMLKFRNRFKELMEAIPEEELGATEDSRKRAFQKCLEEQMKRSKDEKLKADLIQYDLSLTEDEDQGRKRYYNFDFLWRRLNHRVTNFRQDEAEKEWEQRDTMHRLPMNPFTPGETGNKDGKGGKGDKGGKGGKGGGKGGKNGGKRPHSTPPGQVGNQNGGNGNNATKGLKPQDIFCVKFQNNQCQNGAKCVFKHEKPKNDAEKAILQASMAKMITKLQSKARSRSNTPTPKVKKKVPRVKYCGKHAQFLRKKITEDCTDPNCKYEHMSLEKIKSETKRNRSEARKKE